MLLSMVVMTSFCGALGSRLPYIINGHDVTEPGKWPWQGTLLMFDEHLCGCALISDRWVLTAAHCVFDTPNHWFTGVGFGFHDVITRQQGAPVIYGIDNIYMHPEFINDNKLGFPNDIALIRLVTPVPRDALMTSVIQMPPEGTTFLGAECWITGWGDTRHPEEETNILQEAQIGVTSREDCLDKWPGRILDGHICVGGTLTTGSCGGDSGGPLSCLLDGRWYLAGVTSWGSSTCTTYKPSIYTLISHYRGWIASLAGI